MNFTPKVAGEDTASHIRNPWEWEAGNTSRVWFAAEDSAFHVQTPPPTFEAFAKSAHRGFQN